MSIIKQFESQKDIEKINLKKFILVLEDHRKIFTEYIYAEGTTVVMAVLYPASLELNQCNNNQDRALDYILKVENLADKRKKEQERMKKIETALKKQPVQEPLSPYWIYAEVSNPGALAEVDRVHLATFETKIDKKHILNLDQIIKYKDKIFKGKLYFEENYVRLMEGLALTIIFPYIFESKDTIDNFLHSSQIPCVKLPGHFCLFLRLINLKPFLEFFA